MKIQQIRNATLKIQYSSITILLDPWLQDRGTGPSFTPVRGKMIGMKNPLNDLPLPPNKILNGVDFCLVTHIHPDHFTADYLPQDIPVMVQNEEDKELVTGMAFPASPPLRGRNYTWEESPSRRCPPDMGTTWKLWRILVNPVAMCCRARTKRCTLPGTLYILTAWRRPLIPTTRM